METPGYFGETSEMEPPGALLNKSQIIQFVRNKLLFTIEKNITPLQKTPTSSHTKKK